MLWEHWILRFTCGVIAKPTFFPMAIHFTRTLSATQIASLPADVERKNRLEVDQTLISNLNLCLGERG